MQIIASLPLKYLFRLTFAIASLVSCSTSASLHVEFLLAMSVLILAHINSLALKKQCLTGCLSICISLQCPGIPSECGNFLENFVHLINSIILHRSTINIIFNCLAKGINFHNNQIKTINFIMHFVKLNIKL